MAGSLSGNVSLRRRLILVPLAVMVLSIGVVMALMVWEARERVQAERTSSVELADHLVRAAIGNLPVGGGDPMPALAASIGSLPDLRHVRLFALPFQEREFEAFSTADRAAGQGVPERFMALLRPPPWQKLHEILYEGRRYGYVLIVSAPDDEIAELWEEMASLSGVLLALGAVFVGLVMWTASRALWPVRQLAAGLDRLEQGDYHATLPPLGVAELKPLGERFNTLASRLDRVRQENRFLIGKLISVQEAERNFLAHELHDELGPLLFGIKAQAACLAEPVKGGAGEGNVRTILELVDDVQRLNRRILGHLRPVSLRDLGLTGAVAQLVADWRARVADKTWTFQFSEFEAEPDEALALTLYRVVQECLTNAARHSGADRIEVEIESGPAELFGAGGLEWPGNSDTLVAYVAVRDDGAGIPPDVRQGFGLLGIQERVNALGGVLRIGSDGGRGTAVEVLVPLARPEGQP
jgi:two-component system sensor histidine kinase UhpB